VRAILLAMLERLGFQVTCATDGEEAHSLYHQHGADFDLLVSDLKMPCRNGWELIDALRRQRAELPILLITTFSDSPLLDSVHAAGIPVLYKPLGLKQLESALSDMHLSVGGNRHAISLGMV